MDLPDPDRSRVVLVGTGKYRSPELADIPAIRNNIRGGLSQAFSRPPAGIFGRPSTTVDSPSSKLRVEIDSATSRVTDTLVFYYAGHSLVHHGELYLGTIDTDLKAIPETSIPFRWIQQTVQRSQAARKVVILDCFQKGDELDIEYFAHAAGADNTIVSMRPQALDATGSGFTGELMDVLRAGVAHGPEFLTFDAVARQLNNRRGAQLWWVSTGEDVVLARNAAFDPPAFDPPAASSSEAPEAVEGPRWIVPGFAGESPAGTDLLGINDDAAALAVLLSSRSLVPPLALGLFGPWGSGKSFFMRTLEHNIARLTSSEDPESPFARRVVSVWFNAWHYTEGNLWASLIHHIFVSLRGGHVPAPQQTIDAALDHVQGVKEARADVASRVKAAQHASKSAKAKLAELVEKQEAVRQQASQVRATDVWKALSVDETLRKRFNEAAGELGLPEAGTSARELAQAVDEARAIVHRGRLLAIGGTWWRSPMVLGLGVGVLVLVAGVVSAATVDWVQTWLAPVIAAASGAAAWLTRQAALARRLLEPAEAIRRKIDERLAEAEAELRGEEELARQRLHDAQAELDIARQQLAEAEARRADAQAKVEALTGERLLDHYLSERVASADYGRYLGVVALAHRDLHDLDEYLRKGSIDRIVLYIDDLDRCPPETVVRVLEAVHLLLALPLFVVVVGVDARWLARSLRDRHPLLLSEMAEDDRRATPIDYLDKIFQLSYDLPEMTTQRCAELLRHTALWTQPDQAPTAVDERDVQFELVEDEASPQVRVEAQGQDERQVRAPAAVAAALILDEAELDLLERVAPLVGVSPRRAKRFLNVYRVVKARVLASSTLDADQTAALVLVTALAIGSPSIAGALAEAAPELTLVEWLDKCLGAAQPCRETQRLQAFRESLGALGERPMSDLREWVEVARPFAWPVTR